MSKAQPLLRNHDEDIERVSKRYAFRITDQINRTLKSDAVAKQYIPDIRELKILPEERVDPIGDDAHTPVKGIVHRYKDRVLLKIVQVCAVYCRYCFRREMVGKPDSAVLQADEKSAAIDYIRNNKNIWEVILTGGDPLVLSARQLKEILDEICAIDHVKIIRIHSRVPVADPARITQDLCAALTREKPVYIAIHVNHADEITSEVETAFAALRTADCILLSQSVMLKGVNDDPEILENLMRRLVELRVKPYYIHHPDLAPGTSHFRFSIKRGQDIMRKLFARTSGLCMPHYMLDIPGGYGKVPVGPTYWAGEKGVYDPNGELHDYRESHE